MPPPPPTSTLFPYTTLFRSLRRARLQVGSAREEPRPGGVERRALAGDDVRRQPRALGRPSARLPTNIIARDRKSTRLNSSHPSISYAVFCLKKKKKSKS